MSFHPFPLELGCDFVFAVMLMLDFFVVCSVQRSQSVGNIRERLSSFTYSCLPFFSVYHPLRLASLGEIFEWLLSACMLL